MAYSRQISRRRVGGAKIKRKKCFLKYIKLRGFMIIVLLLIVLIVLGRIAQIRSDYIISYTSIKFSTLNEVYNIYCVRYFDVFNPLFTPSDKPLRTTHLYNMIFLAKCHSFSFRCENIAEFASNLSLKITVNKWSFR